VLLFNGEKRAGDLQVSALQFDAPFGRAKGSGGLHSFSLDGVLDLGKAFADIGTLFQLDLSGSGKMELTMKSDLAENKVDRFKVDVDINISKFVVLHQEKPIIPLHQFSLIGGVEAPDTLFEHNIGELDVQVVLSSWIGEVFLVVNGEKSKDRLFKGYYTTDSELDLVQLTTLFHYFDIFSIGTRMAGDLQLQSAGFIGAMPMEIRDLSAEISSFDLEGNGAVFHDPLVKLTLTQPVNDEVPFLSLRDLKVAESKQAFFRNGAGLNLLDFSSRNINLHNVQLNSAAGTVGLERLVIPDWSKPFDSANAKFSLSADLGKMTEVFQTFGLLSRETSFSGSSQVAFSLADKGESAQEMQMNVQVKDFGLERRHKTFIGSEDIVFSSQLQGKIPFGVMSVDKLKLKLGSGILDFDATGKVSNVDEIQLLELNGTMKPALDKIASIIGKEFDVDVKMTGQQEEQFVLKYPLWKKSSESIAQWGAFSSFHADILSFNGIELHAVALPFYFDNSKLHVELSSRIGEGRVEFVTDTDFVADPAVIMAPRNSQVMTGVELNDPLVKTLFSKIHPLFGVFTQPSGLIDVRLDSFWWPMGEEGKKEASFVAIFDAREIQLRNRPLLKNILTIFGLEKERLQLQDNEIYCIGKNGGVKCSPVRLQAGDSEIIVGGSVYQDSSLDYVVEVPITKKLVNDRYQHLEGATVKVPVNGTIKEPYFDKKNVTTTIQALMK